MTNEKKIIKKNRARTVALTGMFVAVVAACSQVSIPLPTGVPITLQTAAVALCGYMLGVPASMAAMAVYIIIGGLGIPVFSGLGAGLGVLLGRTGGFILGFIPMAALCGLASGRRHLASRIAIGLLGLFSCHIVGAAQYAILTGSGFFASALLVSVPYLVKDIASTAAACVIADRVRAALAKTLRASE